MKKVLAFIIVLLVAVGVYWYFFANKKSGARESKQAALVLKTHSDGFNTSIDKVMESYHGIRKAFVDADTTIVKQHTVSFINRLDSIPVQELEKDTAMIYETVKSTISDLKLNAQSLLQQTDVTEMRKDFSSLSDMLYPSFFKTINYEGEKLYLQHCPMAFNDDQGANWISDEITINNPYLGRNHPKYKGTMLRCGEVKDSIKAQ